MGKRENNFFLNGIGRWGGAMPWQPLCLEPGQERSKRAFGPCLIFTDNSIRYTNSTNKDTLPVIQNPILLGFL